RSPKGTAWKIGDGDWDALLNAMNPAAITTIITTRRRFPRLVASAGLLGGAIRRPHHSAANMPVTPTATETSAASTTRKVTVAARIGPGPPNAGMRNPTAMTPKSGLIHHGYLTRSTCRPCYGTVVTADEVAPAGFKPAISASPGARRAPFHG